MTLDGSEVSYAVSRKCLLDIKLICKLCSHTIILKINDCKIILFNYFIICLNNEY